MGLAASQFDVIIYGASLNGIIAAAALAERGKSVLLLNQYGFSGGSITESLNCIQKFDPFYLTPELKKIFELLPEAGEGFTDNGSVEYFLNPESVKLALQNYLSQSKIEVLFHVKAYRIEILQDESISVELAAKEGSLALCCRLLIDASDENHIGLISRIYETVQTKGLFNIIASGRRIEEAISDLKPQKYFKISDERYWISFSVPEASGHSADTEVQATAGAINEVLLKYDSRIQLLPVVFQRINEIQRNAMVPEHGNIIILNTEISQSNMPEEAINRASRLETEILNSIIRNK